MFFCEDFVYFRKLQLEVMLFLLREDVVEDGFKFFNCNFGVLKPGRGMEVKGAVFESFVLFC